jgi:hypothetical protein
MDSFSKVKQWPEENTFEAVCFHEGVVVEGGWHSLNADGRNFLHRLLQSLAAHLGKARSSLELRHRSSVRSLSLAFRRFQGFSPGRLDPRRSALAGR